MAKVPKKCPKCKQKNTMEMASERKGGFSGGKAVAGGLLLGPVGIAAGALGKKKIQYQCSNCGYTVET